MKLPILNNFCYCATLKEGVIMAITLTAITNFLSLLVIGQLLGDPQLIPALLGLTQFDDEGELINNVNGTSLNANVLPTNLDAPENVTTTQTPSSTNSISPSNSISDTAINIDKSTRVFPNSSINEVIERRPNQLIPEHSRVLEGLYVMCWLQIFTVSACLVLDLRLLQLVLRPAAASLGCSSRYSRWLLLWLAVYLLELLLSLVSCTLVAIIAAGWIVAAQLTYGIIACYCYLTAASYYTVWRRREDHDIALMTLAPIAN